MGQNNDHSVLPRFLEANPAPEEVLRTAFASHEAIAIAFSGAEDVVLIDMALSINPDLRVFALDTGRLHPETYRYFETVRKHYAIDIEFQFPQAAEVSNLVREKGLFSFYTDGHQECCAIRKVGPLRAKLAQLDGWITGQRRDQSPGTRNEVPLVQIDPVFAGRGAQLIKYNPLAGWTSAQVWDYIREQEVPFNPLHQQGFVSIGCEPCTRAVLPNQHEREGRWWWEDGKEKECGLHAGNVRVAANG